MVIHGGSSHIPAFHRVEALVEGFWGKITNSFKDPPYNALNSHLGMSCSCGAGFCSGVGFVFILVTLVENVQSLTFLPLSLLLLIAVLFYVCDRMLHVTLPVVLGLQQKAKGGEQ
jgi:hypothetical protein